MAHYDDKTTRDLVKKVKPILAKLSKDDDEVYYRVQKFVDDLDRAPDIDHLPDDRPLGPKGELGTVKDFRTSRDKGAALLEVLVDQYADFEASLPDTDDHGPVKMRKVLGTPDARGNHWIETTFSDGHVERVMQDREAFDNAVATMKMRVNERESVREDLREVSQIRELIARLEDPVAADTLRQRANDLEVKAKERRERLLNAVLEDGRAKGLSETELVAEARGLDLHYVAALPGVNEAIEMARATNVDVKALYDHTGNMRPDAKMQLFERLDVETREQLLEEDSRRRDEAAQLARAGGLL